MSFFRSNKLGLVILASRRMRQRYRKRMVDLEMGWRERHRLARLRDRAELAVERERLRELISRATDMNIGFERMASSGRVLGMHIRWPQDWLMHFHRPNDMDELKRCAVAEIAHMIERELRTIDFTRIDEVEVVNVRDRPGFRRWG